MGCSSSTVQEYDRARGHSFYRPEQTQDAFETKDLVKVKASSEAVDVVGSSLVKIAGARFEECPEPSGRRDFGSYRHRWDHEDVMLCRAGVPLPVTRAMDQKMGQKTQQALVKLTENPDELLQAVKTFRAHL
mmetsp:Transcript_58745/g.137552  ORF Transcript_58745/g.137552 Transcript_58745/m.137552 type:complete len:132 (+) Transcript_58745:58-453(+)